MNSNNSSSKNNSVRLQCSNCSEIREFYLVNGDMPERCENCRMLVGWLPPQNCGDRSPLAQHPCYKQEIVEEPISQKTESFLDSVFKHPRKKTSNPDSQREASQKRARERRARERERRRHSEATQAI